MDYNKIIIVLIIVFVALVVAGIVIFNPFMSKTETNIVITSSNELNYDGQFSITLTDVNGTPISNQTVNITFFDSNGGKYLQQIVTDNMGNGVLQLNGLASGQYNVNVTYGGNDKYSSNSTSQQLTIQEKPTQTQDAISSLEKYKTRSDTSIEVMPSGDIVETDRFGDVVSVNGDPNAFY